MNEQRNTIATQLDPEGWYRVELKGCGRLWARTAHIFPKGFAFPGGIGNFDLTFSAVIQGKHVNHLEFEHRVIERVEREETKK